MKISVIVLAKDIKSTIDRVVTSFSAQEIYNEDAITVDESDSQRMFYSDTEYEVLIQNDIKNSDSCDEILEKISHIPQLKLLTSDSTSEKTFESSAIENSNGDIIVFASDDNSYPSNWLSTIVSTYERDNSITAMISDCQIDDSFALGNEGKILKSLKFMTMEKRLGLTSSCIVDVNKVCTEDLLTLSDISLSRKWLLDSYKNYTMDYVTIATILQKLEFSGVLFFNNELQSKYIIDESYSLKKQMNSLGLCLSNAFIRPEKYDYKIVFPIPFTSDKIIKRVTFPFTGTIVFSSFFMIHLFFSLFVIDMIFFSGLFSSLTPWMFLLFGVITSFFAFGDVLNSDLDMDVDKIQMLTFKYRANLSYYYSLITSSIKRNTLLITKPFL